MGLPLALKAHNEGNYDLAKEQYIRAIQQDVQDPIIYQNYGALLKTLEQYEEAEKIYFDGLKYFPKHVGINRNLANLHRQIKPVSSLERYKNTLSIYLQNGTSLYSEEIRDVILDIVYVSRELGLNHIPLLIIIRALKLYPDNPSLLLNLMLLLSSDDFAHEFSPFTTKLLSQLESYLSSVDLYQRFEILLGLSTHQISRDNSFHETTYYDRALECVKQLVSANSEKADKALGLLTVNSWNISCIILKSQDFVRGWRLFDYGLQTPCPGKQRWQRALSKPFSFTQLSLWRGEHLTGKHILLLEEQAIGDVMMFASLLQSLIIEADIVTLFLTERLADIYRRSYQSELSSGKLRIITKSDYLSSRLDPSLFDYQSPIGSICQYRFTSIESYSPRVPCLSVDSRQSLNLRTNYLTTESDIKLIGVSWRGGVKGARLKHKSIVEGQFFDLLSSIKNVRFISLQYGNCQKTVESWRKDGLDIIYDENVNALKDMDTWLSQVSACDAVLSVANTTIHGAGGLNIPTLCLLSKYADWRWLDHQAVLRSYWYPSVGIARQTKTDGWLPAFQLARDWMNGGCQYPAGPLSQ